MKKLKFLKLLGNLVEKQSRIYFVVGFVMIMLFVFSDIFYNKLSSYFFGIASPVFLLLCFIIIFLNAVSQFKIPISINPKTLAQGNEPEETVVNSERKDVEININEGLMTKFYRFIRGMAYSFLIVNILSVAYYFGFPKPITEFSTSKRQVDQATSFVEDFNISTTQMIDSITNIFPVRSLIKGGQINKFKIDTTGNYNYLLTIGNRDTTLSSIKVIIANNTICNISDFCNCDSTNSCLKGTNIEYYKLLIYKRNSVIDTLNYIRLSQIL